MYGWRRRIGLINAGPVDVQAYDFYQVAPEGVGLVAVSARLDGWNEEQFDQALAVIDGAAEELRARQVDFIAHAGVPLVVGKGHAFMHDLVGRLEAGGVPASTAILSAMEALQHLEARRVVLATPYSNALTEQLADFLEIGGFDVTHRAATDTPFWEMFRMSRRDVYDFVTSTVRAAPRAEAAYVPCPHWRVLEICRHLEADTGLPIVTTDGATFWHAFHRLGLKGVRAGFGRLLETLSC